jgi:O-antigen ligase
MPMNNTAIRNRTDRPALSLTLDAGGLRSLLAFALLAVVWISFSPLSAGEPLTDEIVESGDLVNQLGYTGLCAAALAALAMLVDRRVVAQLFSAGWFVMFVLVTISAFTAPESGIAMRSVLFTLIATVMAAVVLVLPPNADALSRILVAAAGTVLALSYFGIVAMPGTAIHQATGVEAIHAGLWRGIFTHKNIAGPVMAAIAFAGIYLMRRGWRYSGAIIALLALVFVWNTGSKTSVALVPAIIVLVMGPALIGMRFLAALLVLAAIVIINAMTIGTVFVPFLDDILRAFDPTTTYTGRTQIWDFAGDFVTRHPWTGFGYDSFWGTPVTANAEQPFDRAWDPRGIVNGHNGFLDIALFMGFPALFVSVWVLVLAPVWHYLRTPPYRENALLADLCMMIVAFIVMNAALEAFFFRRADPVWLTLVVALFGLRLTSRMRIRAR